MRRTALLLALLLCGCTAGQAPSVPWPEPPVVAPPPPVTPPIPPPTVEQPPPVVAPPASVAEAMARIVVGGTVAEAEAAIGRPAAMIPGSGPAAPTARWTVTDAAGTWIVFAALDAGGRVTSKGSARVETIP